MSTNPKNHKNTEDALAETGEQPTFDRRKAQQSVSDTGISRQIRFDDKGNTIMDVRVDAPRRRKEDNTIDLLECLDADSLGLKLEDD